MENITISIPTETEFKQWIRDVLQEYFDGVKKETLATEFAEPLVSREEIAAYLDDISLVTLHAWMKEGLPYYKQGGRVYFMKSEVLAYIKNKKSVA